MATKFAAPQVIVPIFLTFFVANVAVTPALASSTSGDWNDYHFKTWHRQEKAILDQWREVESFEEKARTAEEAYERTRENYHDTDSEYFWVFDPKKRAKSAMDDKHEDLERARERLQQAQQKLKAYLTSTPPGHQVKGIAPFEANEEVIRLRNAMLNTRHLVEVQGGMLRTDKTEALTAVEYYELYLELLGYLQAMHTSFVERGRGAYRDYIKDLWRKWLKHRSILEKDVESVSSPDQKEILRRKIEETNNVVEVMPKLIGGLGRMVEWAEGNLTSIRETKITIGHLRDHAKLARETEAVTASLDRSFAALKVTEPPIVEFEVDISKLRLENVPAR